MTKEDLMAIMELAPNCADNGCRFKRVNHGMGTNGGCRCLQSRSQISMSPLERYAVESFQVIKKLYIQKLNGELEND